MSTPKFAHNVFQTANHEAMRDWYCTVLDAHVVYEDATLTFLTFDDEHHRVALLHPPVEFKPKTAVLIRSMEEAEPAARVFLDELWAAEVAPGYEVPCWFLRRRSRYDCRR